MTQVKETAAAIGEMADHSDKPIMACFMGAAGTKEGVRILTAHNVPNFFVPERAIAALKSMVNQWHWQQLPLPEFESFTVDQDRVKKIFGETRDRGRLQIAELEAQGILEAYGFKIPQSKLCKTPEEAVAFAEKLGYPVVMKIVSPDVLHKTDIGGVRLNISGPGDVRDSFDLLVFRAQRYMPDADIWGCLVQQQVRNGQEVIVGMNRDPQFGPMVMFGLGGIYVEVLKDVSFRIAPFSRNEAHEMIAEIRSIDLLRGIRGKAPSDMDGLVDALLRISQLVTDFPEIVELDINPLMVFEAGSGVRAIDMRLILSD
jgi:acetyltransferase